MTKTMSIRMDRENFEFLNEFTKEQRSDLSKAVRDMVTRGRVLLAVERYKKGEASLGRAATRRAAIDARVPVLSFIYGFPPSEVLEECRKQAIRTIGTATTRRRDSIRS
jgi:hypothetical protein